MWHIVSGFFHSAQHFPGSSLLDHPSGLHSQRLVFQNFKSYFIWAITKCVVTSVQCHSEQILQHSESNVYSNKRHGMVPSFLSSERKPRKGTEPSDLPRQQWSGVRQARRQYYLPDFLGHPDMALGLPTVLFPSSALRKFQCPDMCRAYKKVENHRFIYPGFLCLANW